MGTGVGASNPYNQSPYAQPGNYNGNGSMLTTDPRSIPSYSPPNYFPQTPLIADSRANAGLPTTTPNGGSSTTNNRDRDLDREPASTTRRNLEGSDDPRYVSQAAVPRGMDNVVPVMFVLSLVVNFYLGMLIRKLLTRYRSLLSSVRGQAV